VFTGKASMISRMTIQALVLVSLASFSITSSCRIPNEAVIKRVITLPHSFPVQLAI
jgi:hypothetical protein